MLVLTRKREQSIVIGDNVEIMVLGVSGDKVRLGITAPREVEVFRKEVIADRTGRPENEPAEPAEVEAVAEPEA
ncbi:MAG: carbon storage regulator CsrA [Solirubrobacterales bacterium]|nr:carbon storage regulator CsrA [Solirubrobacterales bacterium]